MRSRQQKYRILAFLMVLALTISAIAVPADVNAASKKKSRKVKAKCSITLYNLNEDTVIKKGKKYKISYYAQSNNGKKVRLRFRSSNRRIATVTGKGVIKARKNGTVKITVTGYVRGRKAGKRTVKIRVGTPVSGVAVSGGNRYLRAGRTTTLSSSVSPGNASNKKLIWSSSNPWAVSVDQAGRITGVGNGYAVITAQAADGSGAYSSIGIVSSRYSRNDTHWIAHRGLHETAVENTADAFKLASQAGFWGCECDIWETRHVQKDVPVQAPAPEEASDEEALDVEVVDEEPAQATETVEDFDIVINHDPTFNRIYGVNSYVNDLTKEEIQNKMPQVCFFKQYLDICKGTNGGSPMVPIIEIKDYDMSDAGIAKFVGMVNDAGLLKTAQFISFDAGVLERTQKYIMEEYGFRPYCGYLIGGGNVSSAVTMAKNKGFSGINIAYTLLTPAVNTQCRNYGLKICTWTYNNGIGCDAALYNHLISGNYNVYSATADGKFY